jgi:hypothetical protein
MNQISLAIKNFPKQQSIFESKAKFKIVVKGRRFGLTKGAANDYIFKALNKTFKRGIWVDTVIANIDRYVERYFLPHLKNLPESMWRWRKQEKILELNGTYIDFRSADRPENIEGFGYDKLFVNEAGIVLKDEYLWNSALKPMLWDYKPDAVIGGTPKGMGVFKQLADRGSDPSQVDYELFHFTSFDNPFLDRALIEQDMKSMPDRVVKQEIYAEFLEDTGVVFRGIEQIADAIPTQPLDDHLYVMGVDLAKVQDFTVITVYDRTNNRQVYQDRFNKLEWPYQKAKIAETAKHYKNALVILDATGIGDPIADDLLRAGVAVEPIKLTNESKKEIIEKLAIWVEQQRIHVLNIEDTKREFNNFTYDMSTSGRVMYQAPQGFNDDIVIAHALAIWSLQPLYKEKIGKVKTPIQRYYEQQVKKYHDEESEWGDYIE